MALSATQAAALNALQARKVQGLANLPALQAEAIGGLTDREIAETLGCYADGTHVAGRHVPGAGFRTLEALVRKGLVVAHRSAKAGTVYVAV
jgi:hypothetical protein